MAREVRGDELRWTCDPAGVGFVTTAQVKPIEGVVGQDEAVEALRFGLSIRAPGQHVFVRGLAGTGRITAVRELLDQAPLPPAAPRDFVVLRNFVESDAPEVVALPPGTAPGARAAVEGFARFVQQDLAGMLGETDLLERQADLERRSEEGIRTLVEPFELSLAKRGLALVTTTDTDTPDADERTEVVPLIDGEPKPLEDLPALIEAGKLEESAARAMAEAVREATVRFQEMASRVATLRRQHAEAATAALRAEARSVLTVRAAQVAQDHPALASFLDGLVEDVVMRQLTRLGEEELDLAANYAVNILVTREVKSKRNVVVDSAPTVQSLLGSVGSPSSQDDLTERGHMLVHAGSLVRADGGTLILDAADLLEEPGAYKALTRSLKSGEAVLSGAETSTTQRAPGVRPTPVPLDVKVVLIGDAGMFYALDEADPDFSHLFKVLVDFEETLPRSAAPALYAGILSRVVYSEKLPAFRASAVAALVEHGARVAAQPGRVTARMSRVLDIAREAAWLTVKRGAVEVNGDDVRTAITRTKRRAEGPGRRFREEIAAGRVLIDVAGRTVGQINGLATTSAGPLTFGMPVRITASAGPGTGGTVNVEREAELSGQIHTKSHYLLLGLLRRLLSAPHPVTFDATVAFEQSYGGVDGDSASVASFLCLLSAITGIPIRQDLAVTGALDQVGNVLPIGAVNEKIEGFYDTVLAVGAKGTEGVVVPEACVGDLILRQDVAEACEAGRFRVIAVKEISEAALIFLGLPLDDDGTLQGAGQPSLLGIAREVMRDWWDAVRPR